MASSASAAAAATEASKGFLKAHTLAELIRFQLEAKKQAQQQLVTVTSKQTVEDALGLLHKHHILSLPIVDEAVPISKDEHFISIINIVDILTAVVFQPVFNELSSDAKIQEMKEDAFNKSIQSLTIFSQPATDLVGVTTESKRLWIYKSDISIEDMCDAFAAGVHRVVVRLDDKQVGLVSQSDVLRFLFHNSKEKSIQAVFDSPITDLGLHLGEKEVVMLNSRSAALIGFRRMLSHNELTALPVIDDQGILVGNLSASDLRGITRDKLKNILLPVPQFFKATTGKDMRAPVAVKATAKLRDVVDLLIKQGVHRVWVVSNANKPLDVVSITDVLRLFSSYKF